jgi:hypothetical protein
MEKDSPDLLEIGDDGQDRHRETTAGTAQGILAVSQSTDWRDN